MTTQAILDGLLSDLLDYDYPSLTTYYSDTNCPKDLKDAIDNFETTKSLIGIVTILGGYTVGTRPVRIKGHA